MTKDEALKMAREALTEVDEVVLGLLQTIDEMTPSDGSIGDKVRKAIAAIDAALAEHDEMPELPEPFMELHKDIAPVVYARWTDQMHAYGRACAEAAAAAAVPPGWKVVPVQPTKMMLGTICTAALDRDPAYVVYERLLAAAPEVPR